MSNPYAMQVPPAQGAVSAEFERLSAHYGFVVIDNVVFTHGLTTVTVDHILVDRYGLLVVDAEDRSGSSVTGTDSDKEWTAAHASGMTVKFGNPLYLNVANENMVRQALADEGVTLDSTQIRSTVVFVGTDLSKLTLVEVNAMKVVDLERIVDVFEARYNFPPNNGQLNQADVDAIVARLRAHVREVEREYIPDEDVPWSQDPAVVAANPLRPAHDTTWTPGSALRNTGSTMSAFNVPAELAGHLTGTAQGPSLRTALLTMGTIVVIVLALAAGVAFLPQLQAGSIFTWTAAWIVLVAIAELVAANLAAVPRSDGRSRRRSLGRIVAGFITRVVVVAVFLSGMWILVAGGGAQKFGESIAEQFAPAVQSAVLPTSKGGPTIERARQTLLQRYPDAFKTVDLDKPTVDKLANGRVTYTWPYATGGSFTLTLDKGGRFVDGKENAQ